MLKLKVGIVLSLFSITAWVGASADGLTRVELMSSSLGETAMGLPLGEDLVVEGVDLGLPAGPVLLELKRFEIFAPDAKIIVYGKQGEEQLPAPRNAYFRGHIAGDPSSWAVLTVREAGGIRGLVAKPGKFWVMANSKLGELEGFSAPGVRSIDTATEFAGRTTGFTCGADALGDPEAALEGLFSGATAPANLDRRVGKMGTPTYTARVGIETDFEYYDLFGNATDATDYAGDLFAYSSTVYEAEVDTSLLIETIFLHSTSSDPWDQSNTTCALADFGAYWNTEASRTAVTRTIGHFLSGKNVNAGIAWVGVLCRDALNLSLLNDLGVTCSGMADVGPYFGPYGYSSGLDANFNIGSPGIVWDLIVVAHEIGHNFNSPHTHCYAGLEGNANPVDSCYGGQCGQSGCYCGAASLPCGTSGAGCGTIMSYCHFLSGGLSNIGFTFGQGHPFGTEPDRVPTRMNNHVVSQAGLNPGCLAYVAPPISEIFSDGFESGNVTAWSSAVP